MPVIWQLKLVKIPSLRKFAAAQTLTLLSSARGMLLLRFGVSWDKAVCRIGQGDAHAQMHFASHTPPKAAVGTRVETCAGHVGLELSDTRSPLKFRCA